MARKPEIGSSGLMAVLTTDRLHERMEEAEDRQDFPQMLRASAEALRIAAPDHRARVAVGRALIGLGRVEEGVAVLRVAAHVLLSSGYALSAIAALRAALSAGPADAEVLGQLHQLSTHISGLETRSRATVPPQVAPAVVPENDADSLLPLEDGEALFGKAHKLGISLEGLELPPAGHVQVPFFSEVSASALVPLVAGATLSRVPRGTTLVTEGEEGNSLFVVISGAVEILRQVDGGELVLARLGAGALFGEMALVTREPRTATVRAMTKAELLEIKQAAVEELAREHPAITEELVRFARRRLLLGLTKTSPIFRSFDETARLEVLKQFTPRIAEAGEILIEEGSPAVGLFLVASGEVRIEKKDADGDPVLLAHLRRGDVFGEIALVEDSRTTATAVVTRKAVLLGLDRRTFHAFTDAYPDVRRYLEGLSGDRLEEAKRAVSAPTESADDLIII